MKRKEITLKRILVPPTYEGELQRDEWIPAFAGMTAERTALTAEEKGMTAGKINLAGGKNSDYFIPAVIQLA